LHKTIEIATDVGIDEMRCVCFFNLGVIYYAIGDQKKAIHFLEVAHRINVVNKSNMPSYHNIKILKTLSLAYIGVKQAFKSTLIIEEALALKSILHEDDFRDIVKLKFFKKFLFSHFEYIFIKNKKAKIFGHKDTHVKDKENSSSVKLGNNEKLIHNNRILTNYILRSNSLEYKSHLDYDYEFSETGKVLEFLFNLSNEEIKILNDDNIIKPSAESGNNGGSGYYKINTTKTEENYHRDIGLIKNQANMVSMGKDQPIMLENQNFDFIWIKKSFFSHISTKKQDIIKNINLTYLNRSIVLRDPCGAIDHFNLNYHPVHTYNIVEFMCKIKSNFLTKEMYTNFTECEEFENESMISGLRKYLKKQDLDYAIFHERYNNMNATTNQNLIVEATNSLYPNSKKIIDYPTFMNRMMDALNLRDYEDSNNYLYEIYSNCGDKEIAELLKRPHIINNFICSDTILFKSYRREKSFKETMQERFEKENLRASNLNKSFEDSERNDKSFSSGN